MRLFFGRKSEPAPRLAFPPERLRELMLLTLATPAGRVIPGQASLLDEVARTRSPADLLPRFPIVTRDAYLAQRERYLNPDSADTGFRHFDQPRHSPYRTAILMEGFIETPKVLAFPDGWNNDLHKFKAQCLVGPVAMLRRMSVMVLNGGARFPSLRRPVLAYTGLPFGQTGLLTPADRDQFWAAFRVGLEEHFLGYRHERLASECSAQAGLHIHSAEAIFEVPDPETSELVITSLANTVFPVVRLATGFTGTLTKEPCACGVEGLRLLNLQPLIAKPRAPRVRMALAANQPG
ncbi:MAG: hypothetical protein K2X03_30055 [Bryobacteraceae bacterium]|nr:hypothetical protein [Bryobacteraceae bacterium]